MKCLLIFETAWSNSVCSSIGYSVTLAHYKLLTKISHWYTESSVP